jgi:hypothetical protein
VDGKSRKSSLEFTSLPPLVGARGLVFEQGAIADGAVGAQILPDGAGFTDPDGWMVDLGEVLTPRFPETAFEETPRAACGMGGCRRTQACDIK